MYRTFTGGGKEEMDCKKTDINRNELFSSWWYINSLPGKNPAAEKWLKILESKVNDKAISIMPLKDSGVTILSVGINPSTYKGKERLEKITDTIREEEGNPNSKEIYIYEKIQQDQARYYRKNEYKVKNGGGLDPTRSNVLKAFLNNRFEDDKKHIKNIKTFIQMDIIPTRTNKISSLTNKEIDIEAMETNLCLLEAYFKKADYIFLGWGSKVRGLGNKKSKERYEMCNNKLKKLIKENYEKCYCFWLNKDHIPVHPVGGGFKKACNPSIHAARTLRRLNSKELKYRIEKEEVMTKLHTTEKS